MNGHCQYTSTCVLPFHFSYAHSSIEFQLRQLADMAFLVQNYDLAFQSYQHLKKDFQGASAWMYYAGAVVSLYCVIISLGISVFKTVSRIGRLWSGSSLFPHRSKIVVQTGYCSIQYAGTGENRLV